MFRRNFIYVLGALFLTAGGLLAQQPPVEARIAGLENNEEYMSLLREDARLQEREDSIVNAVAVLRERLREEAHAEAVKYLASAEEKFAAGNFRGAEKDFAEARLYEDSEETEERYYAAVTQNYTDVSRLLERDKAAEFAYAGERARQSVLSVFGEALRSERAEAEERAQPLRERVHADMEARRAPFAANKKYYAVRFLIALAALVVFAVGIAVSASFLLRTQSIAPTVLTIAFGACTFIAFLVVLFFTRKLYVAARLCRENEKLSSTEEGAELQTLEDRLAVLADVLDGAGESED